MTTPDSDEPDAQDIQTDRAVPPYDGRRETADVDTDPGVAHRGDANVGGATGPVEGSSWDTPAAAPTGGSTGVSPADEQPAAQTPDDEPSDEGVGPTHTAGVPKAEDHAEGG